MRRRASHSARRLAVCAAGVAAIGLMTASCGAAPSTSTTSRSTPDLKPLLLTISDLPSGWLVTPNKSSGSFESRGCPAFDAVSNVRDSDSVEFVRSEQSDLPQLAEAIGWSSEAASLFDQATADIGQCKHLTFQTGGVPASGTVDPISFPQVGNQSAAYLLAIDVASVQIDFDIVVARKGRYLSLLAFGAQGEPNFVQLEGYVTAALAKIPQD